MNQVKYEMPVDSHKIAMEHIAYFIGGHPYGETKRNIAIVLDKNDTFELLKVIDLSLYDEKGIDLGAEEYFLITSDIGEEGNAFYADDIKGIHKKYIDHESDIMILPHYLPQEVKEHFGSGSKFRIELKLESVYDALTDVIKIAENI
ncbi:hypothetical protein CN553_12395 [Bacillus cereus]|uniref:Uncharacterized protein n=1 Tax=Bacillus cereus TaxID=1396 RepID=A0A9X6YMI4_BACCE|nr:hypothetical protein [Bacillus cereus]EOO44107.1 hypothetical protein ICK_06364 [Bacillus cereus BAG1X2-2]EOP00309.1 hypothetical protein ICO_06265 [Bacillus cereus BAG2O-1]PEN97831.1 hypothetical protein CN553_12395 [Bacillus cereus]